MNFHLSHYRPRVERRRPDVAIGWTVRVTITDEWSGTDLFDDVTVVCEAMPLDPRPQRRDVDALVHDKLFLAGNAAHPHLVKLCALFEERRRFADVMNFQLAED